MTCDRQLLQKEYEEKLKKMRPEGDAAAVKELGVGKGGKLGATGGTLLTQYLMRTRVDLLDRPLSSTYHLLYLGDNAFGG